MCIDGLSSFLEIDQPTAQKYIEKAKVGGEIAGHCPGTEWLEARLKPNTVFIPFDDYARMCVDALKILPTTAATDYGSSRQRDTAQLWADMTRGYLGEIAFAKFLEKRGVQAKLGHDRGTLKEYLPSDIHEVRVGDNAPREPRIKIGVKTVKFNGIWLDLPGGQFNHSDIHVQVKVDAGRDHLFSFFKHINVFRDKVLKKGIEVGSLTEMEADSLYESLPEFKPIPAYICGFCRKDKTYPDLPYEGRMGRKHYTVTSWNGRRQKEDLDRIKSAENMQEGNVQFEGIGKFSHDTGYLFNSGKLCWTRDAWQQVLLQI